MAAAAVFACTSPAGAATTIGQTGPPGECGPGYVMTQGSTGGPPAYTIPFDGVITSFTAATDLPGRQVKLVSLDALGGTNYRVAAKSEAETFTVAAYQTETFETRVAVRAGSRIGVFGVVCIMPPSFAGDVAHYMVVPEPAVGGTVDLTSTSAGRVDVAAQLEPDADNDGYGDESQDCAPADASKNTDCAGPTASITKQPKDKVKTKKKRVKVTYEFSASEPGATFDCVLDGKQQFKACASPLTVKVKKGEHTFSVEASDSLGNKGTAASDSFKVKKKKKKK